MFSTLKIKISVIFWARHTNYNKFTDDADAYTGPQKIVVVIIQL